MLDLIMRIAVVTKKPSIFPRPGGREREREDAEAEAKELRTFFFFQNHVRSCQNKTYNWSYGLCRQVHVHANIQIHRAKTRRSSKVKYLLAFWLDGI